MSNASTATLARLGLVAAGALAALGCSGSGKRSQPFLVTMNATNGKIFVVNLGDPAHPGVAKTYLLGSNVDTLTFSADRRVALASDTETSSIEFLEFHDPRDARIAASVPAVFSSSFGAVTISGGGRSALLFNGGRDRIRTVSFAAIDEPVFSPAASLSGPASGIFPAIGSDVVVLSIGAAAGTVSAVDASDPNAIVRTFPWPTSGTPTLVAFSPLTGGFGFAAEADDHFVFVIGTSALSTRTALVESMLDLGTSNVLAVAAENRRLRGLAVTQAGDLVRFDATDVTAPVETGRIALDRAVTSPVLAVSPDDAFALLSDSSTGRFGVFRLREDGTLANVASVALGSAITRIGFSSDSNFGDFRANPFAFALSGSNLFLLDLTPAIPVLSTPLGFSAIQDFFVVPERKGNLIAGVDSSGHVVIFDVRDPSTPVQVSNSDLGIGAGVRRAFLVIDPS
jgi:hypothetical protein